MHTCMFVIFVPHLTHDRLNPHAQAKRARKAVARYAVNVRDTNEILNLVKPSQSQSEGRTV